jgi:hypothetical protein
MKAILEYMILKNYIAGYFDPDYGDIFQKENY